MPVRLNGALLSELLIARGGRQAFIDAWMRTRTDPGDKMDASILSRWIAGEAWPKSSTKFLRLAALLDVDPFALLAPSHQNDSHAVADRIINIVQSGRSVPSAIRFMHGFFGRQKSWPPALEGDTRSWFYREFSHDPFSRSNCDALVLLMSDPAHIKLRPQTFHFAFRQPGRFGGRWLQYGCVFRHRLEISLWHIGGDMARLAVDDLTNPTPVKTWFGPGAAVFRIASLHAFDMSISTVGVECVPAVSFPV